MVTEKMIEAAMTDAEIQQWIEACNHEPARQTLRHYLALRAALSTDAEPVEWQRRAGDYGWQRVNDEDLPHYREKGAELRALYDRPPQPAPSVVVKALEWVKPHTMSDNYASAPSAVGPYRIRPRGALGFELLLFNAEPFPIYESMEKAKAAAQSDYEARIRSALSAQVQDVAETEAEIVERMVKSVRDPFPSVNLSVSRGIDGWRELMRDALRAAAPAAKLEEKP